MRYIVIGAGAVGGSIGARLFEAGQDVVLVARGPHLTALRSTGLVFLTPAGTATLPIPAVAGPTELTLQPDDILLLAVKLQDSAAVLDKWAGQPVQGGRTAGEDLPLFCVQNGVEGERLALRRF
ncbi:MAG: 2-dehydropantoate 2-reductase N-terminal domain-containing protein, partial [Nakamurella sp.]